MKTGRFGFLLLLVLWLAGCATVPSGVSGSSGVYDSADEPKAKGLHIQVNYPEGWKQKAGTSKDMLVQFLRKKEMNAEMLMLQVHAVGDGEAGRFFLVPGADPQATRYEMWKKTIGQLQDTTLLSVADMAAPDGSPAVLVELSMLFGHSSKKVYTRMKMLHVYKKERMVVVSCAAGAEMEQKAEVDQLLNEGMAPVCRSYFASLRFVE